MKEELHYLEAILYRARRTSDRYELYSGLKQKFNAGIHPYVTEAAIAADGIFLTDHGPNHIRQVTICAGDLASQMRGKERLSLYEVFLLLVAIHLHDVGNALGRSGHEKQIDQVWDLVYGPLGFDAFDRSFAERIASVHGGHSNGSVDTLRVLEKDVIWKNKPIRPQLIASLLRLADELSDNRDRANQLSVALGNIKKSSEAYHIYAFGLHSVKSDAAACTIRMGFAYSKDFFLTKLGKGSSETDLIAEIYERVLKMLSEADYCSRYFGGLLRFDRVVVELEIFKDAKMRTLALKGSFLVEHPPYRAHASDIFACSKDLSDFHSQGKLNQDLLLTLLT